MKFTFEDAEALLMRVVSFSKADNVVFGGFVKFSIHNATTIPIILYGTYVHGECLD